MRPIIDDSDSDEEVPLALLKQKSKEDGTYGVKKEAISLPEREAAGPAATHVVAQREVPPGSNGRNGQHDASFNGVKNEPPSHPVRSTIPPRPSVQPGANGLPQRTPAVKAEVKKDEDSSSDSDDDIPLAKRIVALSRTIKGLLPKSSLVSLACSD